MAYLRPIIPTCLAVLVLMACQGSPKEDAQQAAATISDLDGKDSATAVCLASQAWGFAQHPSLGLKPAQLVQLGQPLVDLEESYSEATLGQYLTYIKVKTNTGQPVWLRQGWVGKQAMPAVTLDSVIVYAGPTVDTAPLRTLPPGTVLGHRPPFQSVPARWHRVYTQGTTHPDSGWLRRQDFSTDSADVALARLVATAKNMMAKPLYLAALKAIRRERQGGQQSLTQWLAAFIDQTTADMLANVEDCEATEDDPEPVEDR